MRWQAPELRPAREFVAIQLLNTVLSYMGRDPEKSAYQKRQPFHDNFLRPCPIIDVPEALREIVAESGARPTHEGADSVLEGTVAEHLDGCSRAWGCTANGIRAQRQGQLKVEGF